MKKEFLIITGFCGVTFAGDFDLTDTNTVEIWTRHDLGYVADTVQSVVSFQSGGRYYIRTPDGEAWSDVSPRIIKAKKE